MPGDDDEYSSGSSIDPSQLVLGWEPTFGRSDGNENKSDNTIQRVAQQQETAIQEDTKSTEDVDVTAAKAAPSTISDGEKKKDSIRIVVGQSILDWQEQQKARNGESKEQKATTQWVTIRHENNDPLPTATPETESKLTVKSSMASLLSKTKATDAILEEYTGLCSSFDSHASSPWVDCVAIYDAHRDCYVLEKVNWSTNLKRLRQIEDSVAASSNKNPHKQSQDAEQRVRKRRSAATGQAKRPKKA